MTLRKTVVATAVCVLCSLVIPAPVAAKTSGMSAGTVAPEIAISYGFNGIDSHATLKEWRGKPVVIKFWSPSCPPCRKQLPSLEKLHKRYKAKGLQVVAISLGNNDRSKKYIERTGMTFPVGVDARKKTSSRYGVRAIPATFLVGRDGRLCPIDGSLDSAVRKELKRKAKRRR